MPPRAVDLADYLRDLDKPQLKLYVPEPLFVRLDQLVNLVRTSTLPAARHLGDLEGSELVAAIMLGAPTSDRKLVKLVQDYRAAPVYRAFVDEKRTRGKRALPARTRGRKRRRQGAATEPGRQPAAVRTSRGEQAGALGSTDSTPPRT